MEVYGFQLAVKVAGCKIQDARCRLKNAAAICGVESGDKCIAHGDGYVQLLQDGRAIVCFSLVNLNGYNLIGIYSFLILCDRGGSL